MCITTKHCPENSDIITTYYIRMAFMSIKYFLNLGILFEEIILSGVCSIDFTRFWNVNIILEMP